MYRASMSSWLTALALVAALPLLLFSVYSVYQLTKAQQNDLTAELLQRSEAAANAVNERLGLSVGYLNALANSEAAVEGDLGALYAHARRVAESDPRLRAISLVAEDGEILFITLRPFGTRGLPSGDAAALKKVFETGKPVVSRPFKSPVGDNIVATVGVPVFRDGKVAWCLRMVLLSDSLNQLLAEQSLPADWTAGIVDASGVLVARSRAPERFVGKEVAAELMHGLRSGTRNLFRSTTLDGIKVVTAVVPVPGWDWKVSVGVPVERLQEPLVESVGLVVLYGIGFALVGVFAARRLSRLLVGQVVGLVSASRALERGEQLPEQRVHIREFDDLARSLRMVGAREQQTTVALLDMSVRHEQVAAELTAARCDALTGLPARAMFLERAEGLRKAVGGIGGRKLAFLFVDLDGFKGVNDAHGHQQGDAVLVRTAQILSALTRESDFAGRLGGDEFIVCITAPDEAIDATARSVASRVVEQVATIGFGIGCSIGVAVWSAQCPDLSCVVRRADQAMYEAKRRGKNRYVVYGETDAGGTAPWSVVRPAACELECGPG